MVFNTALESFLLNENKKKNNLLSKKMIQSQLSCDTMKNDNKNSIGKRGRGRPRKYPSNDKLAPSPVIPVERPARIKKQATYRIPPSFFNKIKTNRNDDDDDDADLSSIDGKDEEEEDLKDIYNDVKSDEDDFSKDETFTCHKKKPSHLKKKKLMIMNDEMLSERNEIEDEKDENTKRQDTRTKTMTQTTTTTTTTTFRSSSIRDNGKKIKKIDPPSIISMSNYFQPRPIKIGPDGEPVTTTQLIARYGRIYKRKSPDYVKIKDCGQLKAAPGMRLCRMCKCLQPLSKFYTNEKRYVCKHHHYIQVKQKEEIRFKACPYERLAWEAWVKLRSACPFFGYTHVNYDRHDMMDLMMKTNIPTTCKPKVVPIDPRIPLRPRNVAIVTQASFILVMKILTRTLSAAQYIMMVQSCNLIPENADVGTPWDPFHDPTYKRQEIDVIPILEAEKGRTEKEQPYLEAINEVLEMDKLNEKNKEVRPKKKKQRCK